MNFPVFYFFQLLLLIQQCLHYLTVNLLCSWSMCFYFKFHFHNLFLNLPFLFITSLFCCVFEVFFIYTFLDTSFLTEFYFIPNPFLLNCCCSFYVSRILVKFSNYIYSYLCNSLIGLFIHIPSLGWSAE